MPQPGEEKRPVIASTDPLDRKEERVFVTCCRIDAIPLHM